MATRRRRRREKQSPPRELTEPQRRIEAIGRQIAQLQTEINKVEDEIIRHALEIQYPSTHTTLNAEDFVLAGRETCKSPKNPHGQCVRIEYCNECHDPEVIDYDCPADHPAYGECIFCEMSESDLWEKLCEDK